MNAIVAALTATVQAQDRQIDLLWIMVALLGAGLGATAMKAWRS